MSRQKKIIVEVVFGIIVGVFVGVFIIFYYNVSTPRFNSSQVNTVDFIKNLNNVQIEYYENPLYIFSGLQSQQYIVIIKDGNKKYKDYLSEVQKDTLKVLPLSIVERSVMPVWGLFLFILGVGFLFEITLLELRIKTLEKTLQKKSIDKV